MQVLQDSLPILGKVANHLLFTLLSCVLQLGPAYLIFTKLQKRYAWEDRFALIVVPLLCGLLGYIAFWAYFLTPAIGKLYSLVLFISAVYGAWVFLTPKRDSLTPLKQWVGLALLTVLFNNSMILMQNPGDSGIMAAKYVISQGSMPHDHVIPYLVSTSLYQGTDPRDVGSTWRSSDRPPLQSGMWLSEAPFFYRTGLMDIGYHDCTVFLQCFWVFAFAVLFYFLPGRKIHLPIVFAFALFNSFFHINSVYVWPKLLAASFGIMTIVLLFYLQQTKENLILASISIALSLLSHGGTAFGYLLLLPYWAITRMQWKISRLFLLTIPLVFLFIPWSLYQKYYDPPGDRLAKMHLAEAGVYKPDPRPFFQAAKDAYSQMTWNRYWGIRVSNIRRLWDTGKLEDWLHLNAPALRDAQFFSLFHMLVLLNLGFIFLCFRVKESPTVFLTMYSLATIALWICLMFSPQTTVIHQGSYVPPLLLIFVLADSLEKGLGKKVYVLLGLQTLLFYLIWFRPNFANRSHGGNLWVWACLLSLWGIYYVTRKLQVGYRNASSG